MSILLDKFQNFLNDKNAKIDLAKLCEISKLFSKADIESWRQDRDQLQTYIDEIDPSKLNKEEVDSIIEMSKMWTHLTCSLFYQASKNFFTSDQINKIIELPDCEEDSGRSDSCFGAHFFSTLQEAISQENLNKLLNREHHDPNFFPWLVARNPKTSSEVLDQLASKYVNEYSWRVGGFYTESDCLIEEDDAVGSFVLYQVLNHTNTSDFTKNKLGEKFEFLKKIQLRSKNFKIESEKIKAELSEI